MEVIGKKSKSTKCLESHSTGVAVNGTRQSWSTERWRRLRTLQSIPERRTCTGNILNKVSFLITGLVSELKA